MADFADSAATLEKCGGGFRVADSADLGRKITLLQNHPERLRQAGDLAGRAARDQRGAAEQQAVLINRCLGKAD